jgi:hypothetical protein
MSVAVAGWNFVSPRLARRRNEAVAATRDSLDKLHASRSFTERLP